LCAPFELRFAAATHPALHPGRSARIELDGRAVGFVGELHPRWRQAYDLPRSPVVFELDAQALQRRTVPLAQSVPRQQSAWRDIAVVVPDAVSHDQLLDAVRRDASGLVRSARLFDLYKPDKPGGPIGAHERSLAVRLELLDPQATLTDECIEAAVAGVVQALQNRFGARLRA
jgi:phenylalanyl-tRNA synthetase beta chain